MKLHHTACALSFLVAAIFAGTQAASTTPSAADTTAAGTATNAATDAATAAATNAATATNAAATATNAAATATNAAATTANAAGTTPASNTATNAATDAATTGGSGNTTPASATATGTAAGGSTNSNAATGTNAAGNTDAATTAMAATDVTTAAPVVFMCYFCNSTTDDSCLTPNASTPTCTTSNNNCYTGINSTSGDIARACHTTDLPPGIPALPTCTQEIGSSTNENLCGYCCATSKCNTQTLAACTSLIGKSSAAQHTVTPISAVILITVALQRFWS